MECGEQVEASSKFGRNIQVDQVTWSERYMDLAGLSSGLERPSVLALWGVLTAPPTSHTPVRTSETCCDLRQNGAKESHKRNCCGTAASTMVPNIRKNIERSV